jgi:hypothetical protein
METNNGIETNWSAINKARAKRLIKEGLMTGQGQKMIDVAKKNGKWNANSAMKLTIFAAMASLLLSSCYTYKILPSKNATDKPEMPRKKAYVVNPQLKKEYSILYSSNLFDLSSDSTDAVKIVLYPMDSRVRCMQMFPLNTFVLGQIPETYRDNYYFKFDEISKDSLKENQIDLCIGQKIWFWSMFVFNKKFDQKAGKLLKLEYQ